MLHCLEVPQCCLQGQDPPALQVPSRATLSRERMLWKGDGSESCPCHYLQSH